MAEEGTTEPQGPTPSGEQQAGLAEQASARGPIQLNSLFLKGEEYEPTAVVPLRIIKCFTFIAEMVAEEMHLFCENPRNYEGTMDLCGECLGCSIAQLLQQAGMIEDLLDFVEITPQ